MSKQGLSVPMLLETVVEVEGLAQEVRIVHVTDSHLTEAYEYEGIEVWTASKQRRETFMRSVPDGYTTVDLFGKLISEVEALHADALVLTGDTMDFPSQANFDIVNSELSKLTVPYLYTLGNHDWHFRHLKWHEETRAEYYPSFNTLTDGNPAYEVQEVGGLKLITLDNSNYQITPEQLSFFQEQLAANVPCLLFMHIPLYIPSLLPDVVRVWKAPIMMAATGWTEETQADWLVRDPDLSTQQFYQILTEGASEQIMGIFCGHIHFEHEDSYREGRSQYVTEPGYKGCGRMIRLIPKTAAIDEI